MTMPKATKKQDLSVVRTISLDFKITPGITQTMLRATLDDLAQLSPRDKRLGVGVSHPLVAILKKLDGVGLYGYELFDALKLKDEQVMPLADLIPATADDGFLDCLRDWQDGETSDGFPWSNYVPETRKNIVDKIATVALPRLEELLKQEEENVERERLEVERREREREERRKAAEQRTAEMNVQQALNVLRGKGYTITPPATKAPVPSATPAKKATAKKAK
jgi:hypothetical protein